MLVQFSLKIEKDGNRNWLVCRKLTTLDNSSGVKMDNQDLISFASPNPAQKKSGGGQFQADLEAINFNNNDRTMEQKFKAVQNLFATPSSGPPPPPPPRNALVSPNGGMMPPHPNLNRYASGGGFPPNQSYQQNFTQTPSISYNVNPPNQAVVNAGGRQSMFNQQSFYPPPPSIHTAGNSLSIQSQNPNFNQQMGLQRANSANGGFGPIPKSNSWNEEIRTCSTPKQSSSGLRHTSPPPTIVSDSRSSQGSRKSLQYKKKSLKDSLIDLGPSESDAANTTTVSILHDFDPLNESDNEEEEEEEIYWSSQKSNFSESFYDTNDPFSYMEQQVSFCPPKIYHPWDFLRIDK